MRSFTLDRTSHVLHKRSVGFMGSRERSVLFSMEMVDGDARVAVACSEGLVFSMILFRSHMQELGSSIPCLRY